MTTAGGPAVSVVIPTHNRSQLIRSAIDSVLRQSCESLEIIVVNDGSTDDTSKVLESFGSKIRVVTQSNMKRGAARNSGIKAAHGDFVAFLDDDDEYESWHLQQFAEDHQSAPGTDVFASPVALWDPESGSKRAMPLPSKAVKDLRRSALLGTVFPPQGLIVRREAALAVGGFPEGGSVDGSEDFVFQVRLVTRFPVGVLARASVLLREHSGRGMKQLDNIIRSRREALELLLSEDSTMDRLDSRERSALVGGTHRFCAALLYEQGRMSEARDELGRATRVMGPLQGLPLVTRLYAETLLGGRGSRLARRIKRKLQK